jgi:tetratricopeptide (TPR) repeat protein
MENLMQTVRDLKTKAKNRRDLGRYDSAVSILDKAISLIREELSSTNLADWKSRLASELADCYGLLGGIHRRWGLEAKTEQERASHLTESLQAYDRGYEFESANEYKIVNSYNMVNRLVSRILLDPLSLSAAKPPEGSQSDNGLNVRERLEEAEQTIRNQLKVERRGDIWALADLALVTLLLDHDDPISAYAEFNAKSPPDFAYESALSAIRPIAELRLPVADKLRDAVELLQAKVRELQNLGNG